MADYHQDPCYCSFQGRRAATGGATFDYNHCQYEHRREESRGPLHRTLSSSTRDCHQHHPSSHDSPCPGSHRSRCSECRRSLDNRSVARQEDHPDLVRALEEIFDQRSGGNELSRLLDELTHRRNNGNSDSRRVLGDVVGQLLDRNGRDTSHRPVSTANRDTLIDLILRITSNSNSGAPTANSAPGQVHGICPGHAVSGIDAMGLQTPWMPRDSIPVSMGMWPVGMGMAMPRSMMYAAPDHVRPVPRWMTGVWR